MPAYPQLAAFKNLLRAVNPGYHTITSSLSPLIKILNNANNTVAQVTAAITILTNKADPVYASKALKYKDALNFLQRTYPVPIGQWVRLSASQRSRAARFDLVPIPPSFNPYGPTMYNNVTRLQPNCNWEGAVVQSVEDFVYTTPGAVGAVLIHIDAIQPGMHTMIDGMAVVDHMKSVLKAIQHRNGGVCALHIGATTPVCADLTADFNSFAAPVAVNELGARHMGSAHVAFNNFVANYQTVVVMGFDSDVCVRANMFGSPEYPPASVVGTSSLPPLTGQADVVTSRALLVTTGTIGPVEYSVLTGL